MNTPAALPQLARVLRKHFGPRAAGKAAAVLADLNAAMLTLASPRGLSNETLDALAGRRDASSLPLDLELRLALCGELRANRAAIDAAALAEAAHRARHRNPVTRELRP